jgi:hypothetical protein
MALSWKKMRRELKQVNLFDRILNPTNALMAMILLFAIEIFVNIWVIRNVKCEYISVCKASHNVGVAYNLYKNFNY